MILCCKMDLKKNIYDTYYSYKIEHFFILFYLIKNHTNFVNKMYKLYMHKRCIISTIIYNILYIYCIINRFC